MNCKYDTKDELSKWAGGGGGLNPNHETYGYNFKYVAEPKIKKLPPIQYRRIKGFRPRSKSAIFYENIEVQLNRVRKDVETKRERRRRTRSLFEERMPLSQPYRMAYTMLTDYVIPDERLTEQEISMGMRKFKEGSFSENFVIHWCEYHYKKVKEQVKKGNIKDAKLPELMKYYNATHLYSLNQIQTNIVGRKRIQGLNDKQIKFVEKLADLMFPSESFYFDLRESIHSKLSGAPLRKVQRLFDIMLQRAHFQKNSVITLLLILMKNKKELNPDYKNHISLLTEFIIRGRIPFRFFDRLLPEKRMPSFPPTDDNIDQEDIQKATEFYPRIIELVNHDRIYEIPQEKNSRRNSKKKALLQVTDEQDQTALASVPVIGPHSVIPHIHLYAPSEEVCFLFNVETNVNTIILAGSIHYKNRTEEEKRKSRYAIYNRKSEKSDQ